MSPLRKRSRKDKQASYELKAVTGSQLFPSPYLPKIEEPLDTITPAEALGKLDRGESIVRKRITGDLILGRENLKDPFEFDLGDGYKSVMNGLSGRTSFARRPIEHMIKIESCIIQGRVNLAGLWFKKDLTISGTRFCSPVDFQHSTFDKTFVFHGNCLEKPASFNDTIHWERANFYHTIFQGPAEFYNVEFREGLNLSATSFDDVCNFSCSRFDSADIVTPCLTFTDAECKGVSYFRNAQFQGVVDFTNSQFFRSIEFSGATFRYVKFVQTKFDYLGLKWEQIENRKLLFGQIIFSGPETLPSTITTDKFNEYFYSRDDATLPEKHRQYDILKGIFIRQGDHVSADGCFYEWKQVERKESPVSFSPETWIVKLFHYLNWLSCGYGVKPIRTLFFSAMIILLFASCLAFLDAVGSLSLNSADSVVSWLYRLSGQFLLHLEASFTTFMNFSRGDTLSHPVGHYLFLVEQLLGWLTLLLFVTTYTRIMLR